MIIHKYCTISVADLTDVETLSHLIVQNQSKYRCNSVLLVFMSLVRCSM